MNPGPLGCIGGLGPLALHPFAIGKPRAILQLTDHPRRHIGLVVLERRGRQRQLGLVDCGITG
ncbi:MAG: hypothetical protein JO081_08570 [Alphaproteobacteria bacterium]|nr:hypothetical protein [Alphaproteobacteria bacterium]